MLRLRALVSTLAAFGCGVCTVACKPAPATQEPTGEDGPGAGQGGGEPGSTRAGEPRFVFVALGGHEPRSFAEMIDAREPALVHRISSSEDWPAALDPLVDLMLGSEDERLERFEDGIDTLEVDLDAAKLEELGVTPPAEQLWLVGPQGPCRARVGAPSFGWTSWGEDTVELRWRLILDDRPGCELSADPGWSQIAIVAAQLPAELRYRPAEIAAAQRIDPERWTSRYAPELQRFVAGVADLLEADEFWVQQVVIPETDLVELTFAAVERHSPKRARDRDPCMDRQLNGVVVGHFGPKDYQLLDLQAGAEISPDDSALQGAFVEGEEVRWTVHEHWGQALVHAPGQDPPTVELSVANFPPESFGEHLFSQVEYCGP